MAKRGGQMNKAKLLAVGAFVALLGLVASIAIASTGSTAESVTTNSTA
jgi:hypothetical protein